MRWIESRGLAACGSELASFSRGAAPALAATVVLAGCLYNNGDGGGSATPAATPVVSVSAAAVEAKAPPETNDVSLAKGILFPLYPLFANGGQVGTRREADDGSLTVTYRSFPPGSGTNNQSVFAPADILRDPSFLAAPLSAANPSYFEIAGDPRRALSLTHSRFGFVVYEDATTRQKIGSPFYFGYETPVGQIPTSGYAEYNGLVVGFLGNTSDGFPNVEGDINLRLSLDSNRMFGRVSNLVLDDGSVNGAPLGVTADLVKDGNAGVPLSRVKDVPHYAGNLTGTRVSGATTQDVTGTIDGRLFGWSGNETAGNISIVFGDQRVNGSYGATSNGGFLNGELNPPEVIANNVANDVRTANGIAFPLKSNVGPVPAGSRTLNADGSLKVVYPSSEGTSIIKSIVVFAPANVETLPDGTLRAEQDGRIYTESLRADSGTSGNLQYSRFGNLQFTDDKGKRQDRPFAFGYATPPASVPTSGSADYYGSTNGVYQSGTTTEAMSGLVNLRADFAQRDVTGHISAIEITNAAGQIRRPGLMFDFVTPTAGRINEGKFTADVTGSGAGSLIGQFYGLNYDEVSGTWFATIDSATDTKINGAFGTRTTASSHPSGPAGLQTWNSTTTALLSNEPFSARFIRDDAGVVTAERPFDVIGTRLKPLANGGIELNTQIGGTVRELTLTGSQLSAIDPSKRGINRFLTGSDGSMRMNLGGASALSYTRFGYWEDISETPRTSIASYFHVGSLTPVASMPTSGTATYQGATIGQALAGGTLMQIQGQMNMAVDFGARSMTGSLFGFSAINTNTGAAATSPISSVTMNGSFAAGANAFTGTTAATVTGQSTPNAGSFSGGFYGRAAQEIGGVWNAGAEGANVRAWGAFGGSR